MGVSFDLAAEPSLGSERCTNYVMGQLCALGTEGQHRKIMFQEMFLMGITE